MNFEIKKKYSETWRLISQALMVARGDLGVELELERVPFAQKLLIRTGESSPNGRISLIFPF
jgi:pyruvate kinase